MVLILLPRPEVSYLCTIYFRKDFLPLFDYPSQLPYILLAKGPRDLAGGQTLLKYVELSCFEIKWILCSVKNSPHGRAIYFFISF